MRNLSRQERAALDAVARQCHATWVQGKGGSSATLLAGGQRVAVDVTALKPRGARRTRTARPHLRFDKVATGLLERLQAALDETVPKGSTVLVTITAPIRLASQTTAALQEKINALLERRTPGRDGQATIHGNRVRIRLLRGQSERAPGMIGFVHNPETDPLLLLDLTDELLGRFSSGAHKRAGDRWLVMLSHRDSSCLEAYRCVYSQLRMATGFRKIFLVFSDRRVGILAE